ncbi:MAG: hypothetical protein Q8J68_14595 [Methanolobus sp.]|uniref:hypothetical protein n=1 Tax=Methanolobus sp. TaxID=1874737 RepID=UPI00272EFA7F|nr:hypothetical protein [Methanolobus sp.]MDP2218503.1 hypothetical protein [Methanolobus sp.]
MGKNPAFLFYPSDWQRDLDEHSLEIEGAWIRICCRLWWAPQRGRLTLTQERWATILRTDIDAANRIIDCLLNEKIASGQRDYHGYVTLWSRRIIKDEKEREFNRLRQQRFRIKEKRNANITPHITEPSQDVSVSVSVSDTNKKKIYKRKNVVFVCPSLNEIMQYCKERGNNIDPEEWMAFYESNGWMVGKNNMKNWKAAIVTWEKRKKGDVYGRGKGLGGYRIPEYREERPITTDAERERGKEILAEIRQRIEKDTS